jgi:hypothetical protein
VILVSVQKQEACMGSNLEVRFRRWLEACRATKFNVTQE